MKYINASGGGGGGTGSDELTALNEHVLEPHTAVTKESDDDPATGTMKNLTSRATIQHKSDNPTKVLLADNAFISENTDGVTRVQLRYNAGAGYIANNTLIGYPADQAGANFGITADKIANGQVVLGMTGTYKGLGNATAAQVLTGYSFSTASLSNAGGSMPNHGAWGTTLAINGNVTIPAGYHNGSGRVSQSIATKGATTITPRAAQQTAVGAGTYCSGNIIVAGNGNFVAGNIKKGVNIWGVVGTFEGYVPTSTDLYLRGNNIAGWTIVEGRTGSRFDSGMISIVSPAPGEHTGGRFSIQTGRTYNWAGFTYLNVEVGNFVLTNSAIVPVFRVYRGQNNNYNNGGITQISLKSEQVYNQTFSFYIGGQSFTDFIQLYTIPYKANYRGHTSGNIYRIWFS